MLIFDDRFARQNRCEPPPEFPLASPYTSIVRHLSGRNLHAPTRHLQHASGPVDSARGVLPTFTFIARPGFAPKHSRGNSTPWSVFQDGSLGAITSTSVNWRSSVRAAPLHRGLTLTEASHIPLAFIAPPKPTSTCAGRGMPPIKKTGPPAQDWPQVLPFQQFHVLLTLFPGYFSSFDHSTCALSVSGQYLALGEIYLPFRAAFPNYSTLRKSFTSAQPTPHGTFTLIGALFNGTWVRPCQKHPLQITTRFPDFKFELLPLHSPLLRQSLLVSFPPLIDMLKFSG